MKLNQLSNNIIFTNVITQIDRSIVFIDSKVHDYQTLALEVVSGTEVIILDAEQDGIKQITRVLSKKLFSTIHIVSHGSPGCLYLGNTQLSLDTLNQYASELKTWFDPPCPPYQGGCRRRGDLLLYGCHVAAGDAGKEFITKLHNLTGAKIAASTTRIGNAAKDGNWDLDYQTSKINASIAFTLEVQQTYTGVLVDLFKENFDPTTNTWTVNPNSTDNATTSATGRWDIGDPVGHSRFGSTAFEELEAYNGTNALVTGISSSSSEVARTSGSATNAVTTRKSSNFTLSNSPNFNTLDFRYYLSTNDTSSVTGTDSFKVELVRASDNTVLSTVLNAVHAHKASSSLTRTGAWGLASTSLDAYAGQTAYLRLTATDASNNSILEAGIDAVNVTSLDKSSLYTANEVYSLGNRIWNDADNDGSFDTGEAGINSVVVNLYKDSNNDGTPDGGIVATDTTSNGGYYRFDNLLADSYIVEVAASNFNTGNPLAGLISSSVDEADPDSNVDKNDNGVGTASSPTNGIRSATVTLGSSYIEPTGETELEPLSFSTVSVTAADPVPTSPSIYVNAIDGLNRGRVVEAGTYFDAFNVDVTGYGNDFTGFCIEFAEFVTPGTYDPVNATGPGPYYNTSYNDSADISSFFGVDPNASNYGIVTQAELNLISTVWYNKQTTLKTNVNDAAAMQALIWELQNDQIFDLSSGNFYLDPNAGTDSTTLTNTNNTKTTVETWVNNFNTGTWTGSLPLAILTVEDTQDIIVNLDLGVGSTDSQSNLTADFGFTDQIDYGDALDTSAGTGAGNYTTTSANGGASHGIISGLSIGSTTDADNGTLQNTAATADDNNASDDEDGVTFGTKLLQTNSSTYSVSVNVNNTLGSNATLVGWIDFDHSGTFDADEAVRTSVASGGSSTQTLTWSSSTTPISGDILGGTTYARFRLSTDASLNTIENSDSVGNLPDGEVEDYQICIANIYGTRSSDNLTASATSGDDVIFGDEGQDTLSGGAGNDKYFYSKTSEGVDIITDFNTNGDVLDFRGIVANELGNASNPFGDGYVKAVSFGSHTMIQVDFDASGSLNPKDVVLLQSLDSTTISASTFIFV